MPANNVGNPLDTAGNIQVDFVWGNMARQPNDVRTSNTNTGTDIITSTNSTDPQFAVGGSKRLVPGLDGHDAILGDYAGYPSFSPGVKDVFGVYQGDTGKFGIDFVNPSIWATATQSSTSTASLTSVTIAAGSPNPLANIRVGQPVFDTTGVNTYIKAGTVVTGINGTTIYISQPPASAMSSTAIKFNVDPVIVTTVSSASLGAFSITVASASGIVVGQAVAATGYVTPGTIVTSVSGTSIGLSQPLIAAMSSTTVKFGIEGTYAFTPYIATPDVRGLNAAATDTTVTIAGVSTVLPAYSAQDALRDSGYQNSVITIGSNQANTAISITNIARTVGSFDATITGVGAAAQYPVGTRITVSGTSSVDGTWTVKSVSSTNLVTFTTNASTVISSGTGSVVGVSGTVFSQSDLPTAYGITGASTITIVKYA